MNQGQAYTLANEGRRHQSYDDATGESIYSDDRTHQGFPRKGVLTIGVGHTGTDFKPGDIWTEQKVTEAFDNDYAKALSEAYALIRNNGWNLIGEARQAVLTDMAFEMGGAGLAEFKLMLNNIRSSNWEAAALEIGKSKYAAQAPIRAARNIAMMKTGEWQ